MVRKMIRNEALSDLIGIRLKAAQLVAEGELTAADIARKVGVGRATLFRWMRQPKFQARVAQVREELGELTLRYSLALRGRRLLNLDQRHEALCEIVRERGASPEMRTVPGGRTGFIVRKVKRIGSGKSARVVEEYEFDAALARAFLDLEERAAREVGEWGEAPAPPPVPTDNNAAEVNVYDVLRRMTPEQRRMFDELSRQMDGGGGGAGAASGAEVSG